MYNINFTTSPSLRAQLSGVKYTHVVVKPAPELFYLAKQKLRPHHTTPILPSPAQAATVLLGVYGTVAAPGALGN